MVLCCAEPNEAISARLALRGAAIGFKNVHPLSGGLEGWRRAGFPSGASHPRSLCPRDCLMQLHRITMQALWRLGGSEVDHWAHS